LIAGIAAALAGRPLRVVGAQAEVAPFMQALLTRGTQAGIPDRPSLADGLTGAVDATAITIPIVQRLVSEIFLVNEEEIARAVAFAYRKYGEVLEPSAAVGLSAVLTGQVNGPAVIVISGGNISAELHARLCAEVR
jgi:threonine dehydratase